MFWRSACLLGYGLWWLDRSLSRRSRRRRRRQHALAKPAIGEVADLATADGPQPLVEHDRLLLADLLDLLRQEQRAALIAQGLTASPAGALLERKAHRF